MIYFPVIFFCMAGFFITLLQDRYRIWTTVAVMAGVYILSLVAASLAKGMAKGPELSQQVPCWLGAGLFFAASIFIHTNNLLQKFFVAMLCVANYSFCLLFVPLLLGVLPFSTAGAMGGVLSILAVLLLYLLTGMCLYRPLQRFSQRGPSLFLGGMLVLSSVQYLLCLGKLDRFLGILTPNRRLFLAVAVYCVLIFCFRSIYQAGRWQAQITKQAAHERMLAMESGDFLDMLAAVREVRAAQKSGEYALDTIDQLLREDQMEKISVYIRMTKRNAQHNPILANYHENPYLNGVIATKAAYAFQNEIDFECNASSAECPIKTSELCVLINELLSRACQDAASYEGKRRLRFTAIPGEDSLRLEVVFTGTLPEKERFSPKGKKFTDLLAWLLDDPAPEDTELQGLDNAAEIVLAHSGSLTVSCTGEEVIIRALLRF